MRFNEDHDTLDESRIFGQMEDQTVARYLHVNRGAIRVVVLPIHSEAQEVLVESLGEFNVPDSKGWNSFKLDSQSCTNSVGLTLPYPAGAA